MNLKTVMFYLNFLFLSFVYGQNSESSITIDVNYPGGNVIIETDSPKSTLYYSVTSDTVVFRPDLRDTPSWFYWNFKVNGAANKTLYFKVSGSKIAAFGPAISKDKGKSWKWMYDEPKEKQSSFSYAFDAKENEVMFSAVIPYLQSDLEIFTSSFRENENLKIGGLTISEKGRHVEEISIKHVKNPKYKVLLTTRHHACESMASYLLEGIMTSVLEGDDSSLKWLQKNVEFIIMPFMDKDGVEDGDQGKNRMPKDHNEDYLGESIYNSTRALRKELLDKHSNGKLKLALDLHCPGLAGEKAEKFFAVGVKNKEGAKAQKEFVNVFLEQNMGQLKLNKENVLMAYGTDWNVESKTPQKSSREWFSDIESVEMASTFELPYASMGGQMVTPETARGLGRDMAKAISVYLQKLK